MEEGNWRKDVEEINYYAYTTHRDFFEFVFNSTVLSIGKSWWLKQMRTKNPVSVT